MASTLEKAKYQRIAQDLREQIRSGVLQPGDRLPSFSEMHAQHGATTTTVERSYTILQQEGLVKREKGRGIFVAEPGRPLMSDMIGVTGIEAPASYPTHPWAMQLLAGIRKVAAQAEKEIILYPRPAYATIKREKVDGILNLEPYHHHLSHLPADMPLVSALSRFEGRASVVGDEAGGVRHAVEHLLELGHRRIGYLAQNWMVHAPSLRPRITAYREALLMAGIDADERWLRVMEDQPPYRECGYDNMKRWLADDWDEMGCTALLAQNDDIAIGAMQALLEAGLRIPGDVSIIGFDGTDLGKYCLPHLTSVALPLEEIGAQAMQLLLQSINGEPVPFSTLELPTRLVLRDSTAKPRAT